MAILKRQGQQIFARKKLQGYPPGLNFVSPLYKTKSSYKQVASSCGQKRDLIKNTTHQTTDCVPCMGRRSGRHLEVLGPSWPEIRQSLLHNRPKSAETDGWIHSAEASNTSLSGSPAYPLQRKLFPIREGEVVEEGGSKFPVLFPMAFTVSPSVHRLCHIQGPCSCGY